MGRRGRDIANECADFADPGDLFRENTAFRGRHKVRRGIVADGIYGRSEPSKNTENDA
jgi:hypothetical protein